MGNAPTQDTPMYIDDAYRQRRDAMRSEKVRMPQEEEILNCADQLQNKWELVKEHLSNPVASLPELMKVMALFSRTKQLPDLDTSQTFVYGLRLYLEGKSESQLAPIMETINKIQKLVLELPTHIPSIEFLLQQAPGRVTLSKYQVSIILACSFFSLWPQQVPMVDQEMPNPNMSNVFIQTELSGLAGPQQAKFECFMNYFNREHPEDQFVSFERTSVDPNSVDWVNSQVLFCPLRVEPEESIQNLHDCAQVDFANKFLGGGVLQRGCVQEEIMFSVCPECIAGMLFCAVLAPNEAILIRGCERYCDYTGYGFRFEYSGDFVDPNPLAEDKHKEIDIIAIDAVRYRAHDEASQFQPEEIAREITKAYSGFVSVKNGKPIATGNWGCGVFNGVHQLKALIQLIAASQAGKSLVYCAFHSEIVNQPLVDIHKFLVENKITVGQLIQALLTAAPSKEIFGAIQASLLTLQQTTQP